ncbi:MAG: hypothetical protein GXO32_04110 [Crenarchaeota archaeon]|nr:hypothetical protein [Thermoproteota archaeon]
MAVVELLNPGTLALVMSCASLGIAGIVLAMFVGGRKSRSGDEMYIGGESEQILKVPVPSSPALYWGIVKKAMGKVYHVLRDVVHSGRLNEWCGFMAGWFLTLLVLATIAIIAAVTAYAGW